MPGAYQSNYEAMASGVVVIGEQGAFNGIEEFQHGVHGFVAESTHETVLNLPGETLDRAVGTCVLASWWDEDSEREIHPFFDFYPPTSTSLKIILEIPDAPQPTTEDGSVPPKKYNRGCVTVMVYDKPGAGTW